MADFSAANGGLIAFDDLTKFKADVDEPKSGRFRGHEVYKPGFWTQGPVMIQTLQILEGYDLRALGYHSSEHIHLWAEAAEDVQHGSHVEERQGRLPQPRGRPRRSAPPA